MLGKTLRILDILPWRKQTNWGTVTLLKATRGQKNDMAPNIVYSYSVGVPKHRNWFWMMLDRWGWPLNETGRKRFFAIKDRSKYRAIAIAHMYPRPQDIDVEVMSYGKPKRYALLTQQTFINNVKLYATNFKKRTHYRMVRTRTIQRITGHSMRYKFVMDMFMRTCRDGWEDVKMRKLAVEMRWTSEKMLQLYGFFKEGQMAQLIEHMYRTEDEASGKASEHPQGGTSGWSTPMGGWTRQGA
jgi:hypothetical protein